MARALGTTERGNDMTVADQPVAATGKPSALPSSASC